MAGDPPLLPADALMAARRLLIVMLVLLGASTLAAALVPPRTEREDTGTETAAEPAADPAARLPEGELLRVAIEIGGEKSPVVPVRVGDQLELLVRSPRAELIEIPALGLIRPVSPGAPAHFDILAEGPGSLAIRLLESNRPVGRIAIAARREGATRSAPGEPGRGSARDRP